MRHRRSPQVRFLCVFAFSERLFAYGRRRLLQLPFRFLIFSYCNYLVEIIMANRRLGGGMGGPQRGNRSFSSHQPFQGNNVSPWQGNMPSNNSLNQSGGLLGQLAANPQQLALALTNLLQPQQQQMNNPPSLLSLNTSPAFSHQDSRDSFNRFGNRGRSDFRRNEPYNKVCTLFIFLSPDRLSLAIR